MIVAVRVIPRIGVLARTFGRPPRDISLVSGHTSRDTRVAIEGLSAAQFAAPLSAILS